MCAHRHVLEGEGYEAVSFVERQPGSSLGLPFWKRAAMIRLLSCLGDSVVCDKFSNTFGWQGAKRTVRYTWGTQSY